VVRKGVYVPEWFFSMTYAEVIYLYVYLIFWSCFLVVPTALM